MTTAMGPPRASATTTSSRTSESKPETSNFETLTLKPTMGPPQSPNPNPNQDSEDATVSVTSLTVPYKIPPWSGRPRHQFWLEVLKDGSIIDQLDVHEKGAYMFGRVDLCDFVLDHPTVSRFHAVVQFREHGEAYLYDLGSTHGTFINKNQVDKKVYVDLHVGDVLRFGLSSRLYLFQGPSELMPPEKDIIEEMRRQRDRAASLQRARAEASLADGISWGMEEDAVEQVEDDGEEVTWETYRGQLTEKQEKTKEKILQRIDKIANMKKEIDHIRAKDIPQGGLTQGQQTQIARNEQRMAQIAQELENLEETLNESIQESLGARVGRNRIAGGNKGVTEIDEEEILSDDDEFYDRTKKKSSSVQKPGESNRVETADTLLDKRDTIMKEIEDKKELIVIEKNKMVSEDIESGDALDAYMSGLSSKLVLDKTIQIEKDMSALQTKLYRILYLLNIADPTGEAAKKREPKLDISGPSTVSIPKQPSNVSKKISLPGKQSSKVKAPEDTNVVQGTVPAVYTAVTPQWLGAVHDVGKKQAPQVDLSKVHDQSDDFVDYKDRKTILSIVGVESAAPGLITRKQKQVEKYEEADIKTQASLSPSLDVELVVEDAVALLLKHKRGYRAENKNKEMNGDDTKKKKHKKTTHGPDKPYFLDVERDYQEWVPPIGQSGDGRTSLNDRYGY